MMNVTFAIERDVQERAKHLMAREFHIVIERDEDGLFVGEVPQLRGCYSQGETLDELMRNIREVVELRLEDEAAPDALPEFDGVQKVTIVTA